tara:strand:+ start:2639 stop:3520 length:882 start_codon:yes stop_codon:yes gene_type:complete
LARNNSRRLGARSGGDKTPTPPVMDVDKGVDGDSSPLSFVVPTEFVDLPSKGKFYPQNHPLHMVDTIEIRHMTAKDEDILTSRTLLKKGIALDRFLSNVLVNKRIDISKLLVCDKNAMIVAARISGYGAEYNTRVVCPACLAQVQHDFDLSSAEVITTDDIDYEEHNVTCTENGTFLIDLEKMNVQLEVRLMYGADEKEIVRLSEQNKKNKRVQSVLTDQLKRFIVSVNGDTERRTINYVVDNMPAADARQLRKTYQAITPTVDLTQDFECDECGHEQQMEVPFTTDFFWPDR